ncbi:MAG: hypothetical protein KDC23_09245 [Actinobacteria bacterium]|nr:hypothetical protein [Actinomycetota bacterium]
MVADWTDLLPQVLAGTVALDKAYRRERWGFTDRRARQMIEAADAVGQIGTIVPVTNEGQALARIRDGRLYRLEGYATFEGYCRERWGFQRNYANKMIAASEAVTAVESVGTNVPTIANEGQAREVAAIIKTDGPERAAEILTQVAESGPVTAKAIRDAATNTPR